MLFGMSETPVVLTTLQRSIIETILTNGKPMSPAELAGPGARRTDVDRYERACDSMRAPWIVVRFDSRYQVTIRGYELFWAGRAVKETFPGSGNGAMMQATKGWQKALRDGYGTEERAARVAKKARII